MRSSAPVRGLTLIELMVTLSVMAIVVALAAPSFSDSLARARLKSQVSDVANMLDLARSEALKRNAVQTTISSSATGSEWSVSTRWTQPDASVELRSVSNSAQVQMVNPTVSGSPSLTTATTLTGNFRGIFTGFVSTNACKDGDQCLQLRAPGGKYNLRIGINSVGEVITCAVGDAIGGYPAC